MHCSVFFSDFTSMSLVCDCRLKWIVDYAPQVRIDDNPVCGKPPKLRNRRVRKLAFDQLGCDSGSFVLPLRSHVHSYIVPVHNAVCTALVWHATVDGARRFIIIHFKFDANLIRVPARRVHWAVRCACVRAQEGRRRLMRRPAR